MAESRALDLFKEYTGDNAADILSGLPGTDPKTFENTWREFKSGFVRDEDFNRIWSEILGAFANTEGGVLVWGIYANTVPGSKIDAAVNLQLVEKPEEFTTRLKKAAKDAINPPLHGVDIRPVLLADGSGKGFVVCYIPEGKDKPYESLHCKERFFARFDNRCERIHLSFLRQLFNPQYNPRIQAEVAPRFTTPNGVVVNQHGSRLPEGAKWLEVTVKTIGASSLYNGFLRIESETLRFHEWKPNSLGQLVISGPLSVIQLPPFIHPGMEETLHVMAIALMNLEKVVIRLTLYAENINPKVAQVLLIGLRTEMLSAEFE